MLKYLVKKILILTFSLFFNTFFDFTTFLESSENIINNKFSEETWKSWFYKNEKTIYIIIGVSLIILTLITLDLKDIQTAPFFVEKTAPLLDLLQNVTNDSVYNEILTVVTEASNKEISIEECIKCLEKILSKTLEYPSLTKNSEEFTKLILKLAEEIRRGKN